MPSWRYLIDSACKIVIHAEVSGSSGNYTQMILGGLVLAAVLLDTVKLSIRQQLT